MSQYYSVLTLRTDAHSSWSSKPEDLSWSQLKIGGFDVTKSVVLNRRFGLWNVLTMADFGLPEFCMSSRFPTFLIECDSWSSKKSSSHWPFLSYLLAYLSRLPCLHTNRFLLFAIMGTFLGLPISRIHPKIRWKLVGLMPEHQICPVKFIMPMAGNDARS